MIELVCGYFSLHIFVRGSQFFTFLQAFSRDQVSHEMKRIHDGRDFVGHHEHPSLPGLGRRPQRIHVRNDGLAYVLALAESTGHRSGDRTVIRPGSKPRVKVVKKSSARTRATIGAYGDRNHPRIMRGSKEMITFAYVVVNLPTRLEKSRVMKQILYFSVHRVGQPA